MKRILIIVALLAFVYPATAQYSTTIYTDSTLAGQITDAQSAAALTRGFTGFVELRSDANSFINRYVQFRFRGKTSAAMLAANSFTTDSVKVQGLLVKKTAANKMDTVWVNIPLTWKNWKFGINTASGLAEWRDTTLTWLTAGTAGNANSYISPQFKLPEIYEAYRVVNGTKDSGRVVIKEIWERVK